MPGGIINSDPEMLRKWIINNPDAFKNRNKKRVVKKNNLNNKDKPTKKAEPKVKPKSDDKEETKVLEVAPLLEELPTKVIYATTPQQYQSGYYNPLTAALPLSGLIFDENGDLVRVEGNKKYKEDARVELPVEEKPSVKTPTKKYELTFDPSINFMDDEEEESIPIPKIVRNNNQTNYFYTVPLRDKDALSRLLELRRPLYQYDRPINILDLLSFNLNKLIEDRYLSGLQREYINQKY